MNALKTLSLPFALFACAALSGTAMGENNKLVVHEWGTFTEYLDLTGTSIGGINTDDEPVPAFVHRVGSQLLEPTVERWRKPNPFRGKALRHMDAITMRLETPVVYFYPPKELEKPLNLTVDVQFRGGWLSEFYPAAASNTPGIAYRQLDKNAVGTLQWSGLEVGALGDGVDELIPDTDDHVWLAPRKTKSSPVRIRNTKSNKLEAENYLFYRGVGGFTGPLRVAADLERDELELRSRFYTVGAVKPMKIAAAWLVSIQEDGGVAFRSIDPFTVSHEHAEKVGRIQRSFSEGSHSPGNMEQLQSEMHAALVEDGLYDDEATAMLSTWRDAYFRSAGLRLFYIVPREWTDDRMPLTINYPAEINRVMVGRIELVSDRQLELLNNLKSQPMATSGWIKSMPNSTAAAKFRKGENNLDELLSLGVPVPENYQSYVALGRFRNALLRHEAMLTGNPKVLGFLRTNGLMTSSLLAKYPVINKKKNAGLAKVTQK